MVLFFSEKNNLCGKYCDWFKERYKISSRVNEDSVVEEIEVIKFRWRYKCTRFGGSCDENWFKLLFLIHSSLKWRSDELSSGNRVNWFDDKSRYWSWVSLMIWFELRSKCVRLERQYNSDGMKESLLSLNERCLSFVIIYISDGIISMFSLFNINTSSLIQFFIFNENLLILLFQFFWNIIEKISPIDSNFYRISSNQLEVKRFCLFYGGDRLTYRLLNKCLIFRY
jgi:hypothetical protein